MWTRSIDRILAVAAALAACSCAGNPPAQPERAGVPAPPSVALPAPVPPSTAAAGAPRAEMFHAIFDAGSSGLRLQIFRVERRADGGCLTGNAPPLVDEETGKPGLADLTAPTDPGANAGRMVFPLAEKALADLWGKAPAEIRAKVTGVALLGTGGFRDNDRVQRGARAMMRKLDRIVLGWRTAPDQDFQALTIEGSEEATFAWLAARELGAENHAILETGGQTCQYARSALDGWTADLGTNAAKKFMTEKPFHACVAEGKLDADACIAAFGKRFAESTLITDGARYFPVPRGGQLWVMGTSWKSLLADQAERTTPATKPAVGTRVSIGKLYDFARKVCSTAPPPPPTPFEPSSWCMRVSHAVAFAVTAYDSALLDSGSPAAVAGAVKAVGANEVWDGKESFTRGAAVSGSLFKECGGP